MSPESTREEIIRTYLVIMAMSEVYNPYKDLEEACYRFGVDIAVINGLLEERYLNGHERHVPKAGNLHLAWEYAKDPRNHHRFINLLRVAPHTFNFILALIETHPVFTNASNNPQAPVAEQLAVTLYRLGRYGNGASVEDVARTAGISAGSVFRYTDRCFTAIQALHTVFVRRLTREEKETEKEWIAAEMGYRGLWSDGYLMYDGTIVVLHRRPGLDGDTYYTRKGNYGLNVQIGNTPSNLRIVDYTLGMVGSAHDASAFEHTCAAKDPEWLFEGDEFAWTDSAYKCTSRTIPVHKEPASFIPENKIFDSYVAHIRVRSEHCMGALKGRFQCLRGLRVGIDKKEDHLEAMRWIQVCIILHNIIIDVEGSADKNMEFLEHHTAANEQEDGVGGPDMHIPDTGDGQAKRARLIAELLGWREMRGPRA